MGIEEKARSDELIELWLEKGKLTVAFAIDQHADRTIHLKTQIQSGIADSQVVSEKEVIRVFLSQRDDRGVRGTHSPLEKGDDTRGVYRGNERDPAVAPGRFCFLATRLPTACLYHLLEDSLRNQQFRKITLQQCELVDGS